MIIKRDCDSDEGKPIANKNKNRTSVKRVQFRLWPIEMFTAMQLKTQGNGYAIRWLLIMRSNDSKF